MIRVLIVGLFLLTPALTMAQTARMKLGTVAPQGSPWTDSLDVLKNFANEKSGGKMKVRIFPSAQLGDEIQMVEGVQYGTLECAGISTASIANTIAGMQIFEFPFLWQSKEEAYYVIDNHFRTFFDKKLQEKGMKLLGWSENGWRHFFTKNKPIKSPADLKGLKFRSQESKVHLAFWKSLGAAAIPLAMPDVYSALERGMIDGGENTLVLISATGWSEVVKNVSLTGHIYQPAVVACNKDWYDKLSAENKQVLADAMPVVEKDARERLAVAEGALVEVFRNDFGVAVYEPSAGEIDAFRTMTKGVFNDPDVRATIGADAFVVLEKGLKEYRSK